jgi:hypothetical protein
MRRLAVCLLALLSGIGVGDFAVRSGANGRHLVAAEETKPSESGADAQQIEQQRRASFQRDLQPLLKTFCVECHSADEMTSGVRVDHLDGSLQDRHLRLYSHIRRLLDEKKMPPAEEPQPSGEERRRAVEWIDRTLTEARSRPAPKNGAARRLTVAQYRNTLRDLLGIDDELAETLPPDSVTRDGFANNGGTLELSPQLLEAYFEIAETALQRCLVNESQRPTIQNFRMDLGRGINPQPCPDELVLGALSMLLRNQDFVVTELTPKKPFEFTPFAMQTKHRFIEGYRGNDTVRGWRDFDSLYHSVFACMRGTEGYPKGDPYDVTPEGLLLRPAIPSPEIFGQSSTYGPQANFKISLRELPDEGRFRVTVRATRYDDGLLLDAADRPSAVTNEADDKGPRNIEVQPSGKPQTIEIPAAGVYQVDLRYAADIPKPDKPKKIMLKFGPREFSGIPLGEAFLTLRLPAGPLAIETQLPEGTAIQSLILTRLDEALPIAKQFEQFEKRTPRIGVHLGLRRDCGSTLRPVGRPVEVKGTELADYVFEGAIRNFPSPDVEKDNVNYLAGIREIGVRSEYTDGRDMPRLLIRSIEFEGPFYDAWPPAPHRAIFVESQQQEDPALYAREVLQRFSTRAFRRPVTDDELGRLVAVWQASYERTRNQRESVRDALLVVLTSPQFLFQIESSPSPAPEPLDSYELASKLSYFLWNSPPDQELLELAANGSLRTSLDAQVTRLIGDARLSGFTEEFGSQWLGLKAFDTVEVDRKRFVKLTRDTKAELRREPIAYLQHILRENRPIGELVSSDYVVANEVVAAYYGLGERTEAGFAFTAIRHENPHLGGVVSQPAILAGLSNGRESHPVKRGAWFARKIIGEPPEDPPPNVPALPEDDSQHLSLREKLERHRNQPGCAKCHSGIDPWGLPFEQFDAGGLFRTGDKIDPRSTLPDGAEVADFDAFRNYLVTVRSDQLTFAFLRQLAAYAAGRDLTYNEVEFLRKAAVDWPPEERRVQNFLRFVVNSPIFLEK